MNVTERSLMWEALYCKLSMITCLENLKQTLTIITFDSVEISPRVFGNHNWSPLQSKNKSGRSRTQYTDVLPVSYSFRIFNELTLRISSFIFNITERTSASNFKSIDCIVIIISVIVSMSFLNPMTFFVAVPKEGITKKLWINIRAYWLQMKIKPNI